MRARSLQLPAHGSALARPRPLGCDGALPVREVRQPLREDPEVLELALLVVGSVDRIGNIALISAAVVAATRILAYVREKTSHELAKAIPLSLAFLLLTGGTTRLDENVAAVLADPSRSDLTTEMLTFLIALEIGLRLLTEGSDAALASARRRRGIDSDLGIWRTVGAVIRRPLTPVIDATTAAPRPTAAVRPAPRR